LLAALASGQPLDTVAQLRKCDDAEKDRVFINLRKPVD